MIGALMAGVLAGCGVLVWLSPGSRLRIPRGRRRSPRELGSSRSGLNGGFLRPGSRATSTVHGGLARGGDIGSTGANGWSSGSSTTPGATGDARSVATWAMPADASLGPSVRAATATAASIPPLPAAALVELTACQLETGLPLAEAVSVLANSCAGAVHQQLGRVAAALRLGLPWDAAWPADQELSRGMRDFRDALEFTATSATASASVLRGQADLVRRAQYRRAERAAEALAVKLVLPLGLCFLPAFMCWGVVPVLMGLLPRAFGS